MIRPLRRRHRWMIVVVTLAVVLLYIAAIVARPEPAIQEALPGEVSEAVPEAGGAAARPGGGNG